MSELYQLWLRFQKEQESMRAWVAAAKFFSLTASQPVTHLAAILRVFIGVL